LRPIINDLGRTGPGNFVHTSGINRPPLVCHVIFRLAVGGLENGVVNLINWMPADAYRHAVLSLTRSTDFRERIQRPDVAVLEADKAPEGRDLGAYRRVWRQLRALRPDIVHTRNLPCVDSVFVARLAGVRRIVHSEHGLDRFEIDGRNRKYNLLRRLTNPLVGRYIALSADLRRWLVDVVGIPAGKVALIYNGVDTDRFRPRVGARPPVLPAGFAPDGTTVIGTIGRLAAVKDPVTLARAFVRLVETDAAARLRLVIIGDGGERAAVEAVLDAAGARHLAWLPGFRDDTPDLYRAFDVFALPSEREGISNTVLEAMASGLPVVATRVGGNPEIVPNGAGGRLVPAHDPAALADGIAAYAFDPATAAAHGHAARAWTEARYAPAAMVRGYRDVYDALMAR
jgi:sugar transferase (PEP-CTERM/EpsH1 system associated)